LGGLKGTVYARMAEMSFRLGAAVACMHRVERANAQLKSWRILRKLRCCPRKAAAR